MYKNYFNQVFLIFLKAICFYQHDFLIILNQLKNIKKKCKLNKKMLPRTKIYIKGKVNPLSVTTHVFQETNFLIFFLPFFIIQGGGIAYFLNWLDPLAWLDSSPWGGVHSRHELWEEKGVSPCRCKAKLENHHET